MLPVVLGSLAMAAPLDTALKTGARAPLDAAVVVGIEEYFKLPTVPHAAADARLVRDFLVYTRGVPSASVRLMDQGANRETMLEAVDDAVSRAGAGGTVWVYFAGHGAASPTRGERMLLGDDVRAELASFESRAVTLTELRTRASAGGHDVQLLLDTCYTGQGRAGTQLLPGTRFAVPAYAVEPSGRVLEWSAAGPNQFSGPLPGAAHGAFTYFAVGALRGWADGQLTGSPDGRVTAEEAALFVEEALRGAQITDQRPVMSAPDPATWVLSAGALERAPDLAAVATSAPVAPPATPPVAPMTPKPAAPLPAAAPAGAPADGPPPARLVGPYGSCRRHSDPQAAGTALYQSGWSCGGVQANVTLPPAGFDFEGSVDAALAERGGSRSAVEALSVEGFPQVAAWCQTDGKPMYRACFAYDGMWYVRLFMWSKPGTAQRAYQKVYGGLGALR